MKKTTFILLSFLALLGNSATAQAVSGSCNSVTITQVPQYPLVYSLSARKNCNVTIGNEECCVVRPWFAQMTQMLPQLTLEKFDAAANNWLAVAGPDKADAGKVFGSLSQGRYRVKMLLPYYSENTCRGDGSGTVPNNEFNLSAFWKGGADDWQFETFHSYKVQFVVENLQCRDGIEQNPPATWNVLERTFFICPAVSGCRAGEDEQAIMLVPNPASAVVRLQNFEPDLGREYRLTIADLTGRIVKTFALHSNEVDISGLPSGMFGVTIERDGKRIFANKLVDNQ